MGITLKLDQRALNKKLQEAQQTMIDKIVRVLKYCGELAVNEAKLNAGYQDQTGNLKSSTGYVISIDGKIDSVFFPNPINKDGEKGGVELARSIAQQIPEIALVVVAGMKYASHVESRGKNVLTSAEQLAKTIVPNLLKQLK